MYVQDIDDATCYYYYPITLNGTAQKWFNGFPNESVTAFF